MAEDWRKGYNEYMREYRRRNPERIKAINKRYMEKKLAQWAREDAEAAAKTTSDGEREKQDD